ncbi:MAG: hypothetical protein EA358_08165 [Flavobacteriales bacterium]|nr:MAG: hypothetical protein EA358_08165 [Flavobacteriales bacterium]
MQIVRVFILCIGLFSSGLLSAQVEYMIRHYTDDDGLPQNSVKSIVRSESGFIWVCTENGLARFDGRHFEVYSSSELELKSNRFLYLFAEDNLIYGRTIKDDFIVIENDIPRKIDKLPAHFSSHTEAFHNIIKFPDDYYHFDLYGFRVALSETHFYEVANDIFTFRKDSEKVQLPLPFEVASVALIDSFFYIFDHQGNYAFWSTSRKGFSMVRSFPEKGFSLDGLFWNRSSNQMFFLSQEEVLYLSPNKNGRLKSVAVSGQIELSKWNIGSAYYDKSSQKLFLASRSNGLYVIEPKLFGVHLNSLNLDEVYYGLASIDGKNIYTSTGIFFDFENGLTRNASFKRINHSILVHPNKRAVLRSFNNTILSNDCSGADCEEDILSTFPGLIRAMQFIGDYLWVATDSSNTYQVYRAKDPAGPFELVTNSEYQVRLFNPLSENTILFGGPDGLFEYDLLNKSLSVFSSLVQGEIRSVQQLDPNVFWIATYGMGVYIIKDNVVYRLPYDRKSYLAFAHYFVEDEKGFVWIPTNRGLFQYLKSDVYLYLNDPSRPLYFHYYDTRSGLPTNEFNGGCGECGLLLNNKLLFLPTMSGLVSFSPESFSPVVPSKSLFFSQLFIDQKPIPNTDTVLIPRNFSSFSLRVISPDLGHPYNLRIEGRLENQANRNWALIPDDGEVRFASLPPGLYKYTVRKQIGFQNSYVFHSIWLNVEGPIYATWWFRISFSLSLLVFLFLLYRGRILWLKRYNSILENAVYERSVQANQLVADLRELLKQQKGVNAVKDRVISVLAHDIRSPLRYLGMMMREINKSEHQIAVDIQKDIKVAEETCNQLYGYVTEILKENNADKMKKGVPMEQVDVAKLVENKFALFQSMANMKKTKLVSKVKADSFLFSNENMLSIILHNLIDNALKYSFSGTILLTFNVNEDGYNVIKVADEGLGINNPKTASENGLGLKMVQELTSLLEGELEINRLKKGTEVVVKFR